MLRKLTDEYQMTKPSSRLLRLLAAITTLLLSASGCQQFASQRKTYTPPTAQSVLGSQSNLTSFSDATLENPVVTDVQQVAKQEPGELNSQTRSSANAQSVITAPSGLNSGTSTNLDNRPSIRRKPSTLNQIGASSGQTNLSQSNATQSSITQGNVAQSSITQGSLVQTNSPRSNFAQPLIGQNSQPYTSSDIIRAGTSNNQSSQTGVNAQSSLNTLGNSNTSSQGFQNGLASNRPLLSPYAIVRGQSGWVPTNPPTVPTAPLGSAPGYAGTIAPGTVGGQATVAPGVGGYDPALDVPNMAAAGGYQPRIEVAPLDIYLQEKRTGRIILGGSVNSDLGVAGQLIIDERNFDIRRVPRGWSDLFSGYAFRGAGQSFRVELMPGNQVERYTANWTTPNLFGYMPYSLSVGGFLFTRQYRDWTERRMGGRVGLGYNITKDLSIGTEIRGEQVKISNPRVTGVQKLDSVLGRNELYSARVSLTHDTRDSSFLATEGGMLQLMYDQAFGTFDYPQGQVNYSRYFRVRERADGMGRHVLAATWRVGLSGSQTPIYENFYAGGFSSMRGFRFRGASPVEGGVQVGGRFSFLGSLEYMFPLTADEMLRGVAFVDYGTVEQTITMTEKNFRVAPGLGIRISVPILGPAPLAFDFGFPVAKANGDQTQVLSFYMGFTK